jgi:YVTN family beta-propeller protein
MRTLTCAQPSLQSHKLSSWLRGLFSKGAGKLLTLVLIVVATCSQTSAQSIGFAANATDGTVSVFAVVTSGPTFGSMVAPGNEDNLIATIIVGKNPTRVAVTPFPNSNLAYVTNAGDNSLWVIDVTKISQEAMTAGSITAQNVNTASDGLQLSQPGGIVIVAVPSGTNKGKVLAFVANQGTNSVSVIDTSNNSLLAILGLGVQGSSTTVPEVAATPDGTQIFVTNNSTTNCGVISTTVCPALWMIDATSVAGSSVPTRIPVSGTFDLGTPPVPTTLNLMQARGVSATQYADANKQTHTLLLVADSGQGFAFLVDRLGTTTTTQPVQVGSNATFGGALMNFAGLGTPASVSAAVIEAQSATGPNGIELFPVTLPLSCCTTAADALVVGASVDSLAVVNPGATTQFIYMTSAIALVPEFASFDSALASTCNPTLIGSGCNKTSVSVGHGATGIAFSTLDANSPPVSWFIPSVSGGFGPPPAVVPANSGISLLGESMVGAGQAISTTLSFGGNNSCTLFGTSTAGPTCTDSSSGANAIGGDTTFPASGVFTVSITNGSKDGSGNPTSTTVQQSVSVGANCTVGVSPTTALVGQTVQAMVSCTAPVNDQLAGFTQWGDGVTTNLGTPVSANGSTPVSVTFSHKYAAASPSGGYPATVSMTDNTSTTAANISTPQPTPVTVTAPSCTLAVAPNPVVTGQLVTATLTCSAATGDTVAGSIIIWGDGVTSAASAATANASNVATLTATHAYSSASKPTFPVTATASDTTVSLAATITNQPVNVTVTAPSCTLAVAPNPVATGQLVTATLTCSAAAGDTMAGSITWGDGVTTTASAATANANNVATLTATHAYSSASKPTFPVTATASDTTVNVAATITNQPINVAVGLACTLSAGPTPVAVGTTVTANLNCAAPAGNSVSGTINWGDGTTPSTVTAVVSTGGAASLAFSHAYASANTYAVTATVTDTSLNVSIPVGPQSLSILVVIRPSCALTVTPSGLVIQIGQAATASLNCTAPANDALAANVNWGDGSTSPASGTASASGAATLSVTHTYALASNPTFSITATVTDSTTAFSGSVNPLSVAITVNPVPVVTPPVTPPTVVPGQPATVPLQISGGIPNVVLSVLVCTGLPTGATCSAPPLTLDAHGSGTLQLTVATIGPGGTAQMISPNQIHKGSPPVYASLLGLPGLLGLVAFLSSGVFKSGNRRQALCFVAVVALFGIMLFASGCGTSIQSSNLPCATCTASGSYTIHFTVSTAPGQPPPLSVNGVFTLNVTP